MTQRPKRVLHVVGGMVRAGVETWLMHAMRRMERGRIEMDFLVHTDSECAYDGEILERRGKILRCTAPKRSAAYARRIGELLRENGPYDAVHSHVHHFSGYMLWLARRAGVPLRIAHSHSDTSRQDARTGLLRGAYLRGMKRWIQSNATHLVGASGVAGRALFGQQWDGDARRKLLHCGIDLAPFRNPPERWAAREALGIGPDELVIGHTGRFGAPKNHAFLVEVAAEVAKVRPDMRLLLVGDGPTRPAIEQRVVELGLRERTIFAGIRNDVPVLLQAMDVFLFPSLWEGLPLTVLEAQAAGLACVISNIIADETDVAAGLVRRVSLGAPASLWAGEVLEASKRGPQSAQGRAQALAAVEASSFNISHSVKELYGLYQA